MTRPRTVCLPAVRMLHDRSGGPSGASAVLRRLVDAVGARPAFRLVGPHAHPEWSDALDGVLSWRGAGTHLHAVVALGPGVTLGDGMLIAPPGALPVHTLAQAAVGGPLSGIVDHPVVDPRMTVTAIAANEAVQCWASVGGTRIGIDAAFAALEAGRRP